jgi:ferredoxin-NADP reductase
MLMVITHMVSLYLDSYIEFTIADLLIPFASEFEPWGVGLGVLGMWAMVLVWATSMVMHWLPERLWKALHFASYFSLFAVAMHSGMVGSDVGTPWYTALSLVLISVATFATIIRVILTKRAQPQRVSTSSAPSSAAGSAAQGFVRTGAPQGLPSREGASSPVGESFVAKVHTRREVAEDIVEFTVSPVDDAVELEWEVGAHITVHLGNGLERQYSLTGDPADSRALTIAVLNTHGPGGGSQWIHDNLQVGMELVVDRPINAFVLKAHHRYQFIASGIGITPIRSMLRSLPASRQWELLYLGRSRDQMAYADELEKAFPDRVRVWASAQRGARADLAELIDSRSHVYACGSESLLSELESRIAPERLHLERFVPIDRSGEHDLAALTVTWAPTGESIPVPADKTVLEAIEGKGIDVNASCRRGVCGSCELRVDQGQAAHLDSVMSDHDKDELGIIYPCVSRAVGQSLTLSPS